MEKRQSLVNAGTPATLGGELLDTLVFADHASDVCGTAAPSSVNGTRDTTTSSLLFVATT
jgi:hypothetical protein